jgi:hypothetical protein
MSYKTERLVDLFPDAYAAHDPESMLFKLLDAIGAEFMSADEKIKRLLKSHWVNYAEGAALDGLGAIYGVARRALRNGELEADEAFRFRLQSTVPLFTGGGTRQAVIGAVRSALGLPFDLDQLKLPPQFQALRRDLEALVTLTEFSPQIDPNFGSTVTTVENASELILSVTATTTTQSSPRIDWTFDSGTGRRLSLERIDSGEGVRSLDGFIIKPDQTLVFTADANGRLSAVLERIDVSTSFVNLNGTSPALLPSVPTTASQWKFRAEGGVYEVSAFDDDAFDLPLYHVGLSRLRFEPLTFDVQVPYFLQRAVADLIAHHKYTGDLFVFEGIPLEHIQQVVDQTRAAGVRGSVHFSLNFFEDQTHFDFFQADIASGVNEDAGAHESFLIANVNQHPESQDLRDKLTIAGVFDISPFDGPFGFE